MTIKELEHLYCEYGIRTEIEVLYFSHKFLAFGKTTNEFTKQKRTYFLQNVFRNQFLKRNDI